jgi:hypothetical protein
MSVSSVFRAAPIHKSEEEVVAEAVPPLIEVAAPSLPGVIVEYDVVSSAATTHPSEQPLGPC